MTTKFCVVSLDVHQIAPARYGKLDKLPDELPPCFWCEKSALHAVFDIIQHGFFMDKALTICVCSQCLCASVMCYDMPALPEMSDEADDYNPELESL
jgi:hypothetical protein